MTNRTGHAGSRIVGATLGAAVGATIWLSLGALALVDETRLTRVAVLPPWTWLGALVAAGAAAGALAPLSSRAAAPLALLTVLWLPWLPWRVPAAFLLWDGPLEAAVWLTAGLAVAWTTLATWRTRLASLAAFGSPRVAPWVAGALAAFIAIGAWAVARPRVPAGDEPHYLVITQSLLSDGDLRIENNHTRGDYLAYYEGVLKPDFMRRGRDRQIYSIHSPGISVIVLPGFALAGYAGAMLTVALLGGLAIVCAWRASYLLTGSVEASWIAALALATAAPVVLHAFAIYPDPVGGACVMLAIVALLALDGGGGWSIRSAAGTGAALALLPWLHTRFAVLAALLGLILALRVLRRPDRTRLLAALFTAPGLAALAWFGYFYAIYGTPSPAAPYGVSSGAGLAFVPTGLAGLLLDQQFGLAANAPVLLLALALLAPLARRRGRLAAELTVVVVTYLAVAGSYPMWFGGYSAPARFAVAVLPVLALPLAEAWAQGGRGRRGLIVGAALVSAAITAALVGEDRGAFIFNGRDGHALLLDWLSPTVDLTLAFPSVLRDGPAIAAADTLVWVVAVVFVTALGVWMARRGEGGAWSRALGWIAAPVALMLGATVEWAGHAAAIETPATSQMVWLERWSPERASLAVQFPPLRAVTLDEVVTRLQLATSPRGGRRTGAQPLLRIPFVPAGDYDVFVDARDRRQTLDGALTVQLGRQELPMEQWSLAGRAGGFTGLRLHLPVDAYSIAITGDGAARDSVARLVLRPRTLLPRGGPLALRAVRFGGVVVFALDDRAYLEPTAFWVRGERATTVVVTSDDGRPPTLQVKAGGAATRVDLRAGGWTQSFDLAADAARDVALPSEALGAGGLTIASSAGFRPSATQDVRFLGVYVTIRN